MEVVSGTHVLLRRVRLTKAQDIYDQDWMIIEENFASFQEPVIP